MIKLKIEDFKVIEEVDLYEYISISYTFVFDEYFSALYTAKINYEQTAQINPIFVLGRTHKVFMATGH